MLFFANSRTSSFGGMRVRPPAVTVTFFTLTELPVYSSTTRRRCRRLHPPKANVSLSSSISAVVVRCCDAAVVASNSARSSSDSTKSDNRNGAGVTAALAKFSRARTQETLSRGSATHAIAVKACLPASRNISCDVVGPSSSPVRPTVRPPIITPPTSALTSNRTAPGRRWMKWPLQTTRLERLARCLALISSASGCHASDSATEVTVAF